MRRSFITAAALLLPVFEAIAGSGGSAYSIFGIGDLRYLPGMRSAGMGYAGIGLASPSSIDPMSPATWSRINLVRLEAALQYEGFNGNDGSRALYRAAANFGGGLLALPISTDYGVVFVGGFMPYSNVDYNSFSTGSQAGINYEINHIGTGGLSQGLPGLSYSPLRGLSIGASVGYLFGSTDKSEVMTVQSLSTLAASGGTITANVTASGALGTFGLYYDNFGAAAEVLRPLSLGLVFSTRASLNTEESTSYLYVAERDTSSLINGKFVIPEAYGVGLAYQVSDRYAVAADYFTQPWGNAEFDDVVSADLRNSYRISVGAERAGSKDNTARWLDRIICRLGFTYNATYVQVDNHPVNAWGITAGLGLPFSGESRMNIGFEYGRRGTTENGLIRDNIFRVNLSLTISELWFVRYEEE